MNACRPVGTPDGPTSPWVETCCICDAPTTALHRFDRRDEWLPYCNDHIPAVVGELRIYAPVGDGRYLTAAERDRLARGESLR